MAENVRMARAMARLAIHEGSDRFRDLATSIVGAFAHDCTAYHVRGIDSALAVEELVRDPLVEDIGGPPEDPGTLALRRAAVNVAPSWTVIRTGAPTGPPRAVPIDGEDRESVTDPATVAAAAGRLTPVVAQGR